jgi:hypothetical protein
MKPSIGRIVRFIGETVGQPYPAIITAVHSDAIVDLQVFRTNDVVPALSVPFRQSGAGPRWMWPELDK